MRRYVCVSMLVFASACSRYTTNPLSPSDTAVSTSGVRFTSKSLSPSGVTFASDQAGKVTILNNDTQAHRFAFYIWDATDESNQQLKARIEQLIPPGQTGVLTVAFAQECGRKYQRDVYVDLKDYEGATTEAETRNYFFAAAGVYWQSEVGTCAPGQPIPPPPNEPRCQDREANNYGGLLPCTYGEGGENPPPPPIILDVCPNLEGNQSSVPQGYVLNVDGQCVLIPPPPPTTFLFCHVEYHLKGGNGPHAGDIVFVGEQQLNIPLNAILNGHSDPAHHFYDFYGVCDGVLAPVHGPQ